MAKYQSSAKVVDGSLILSLPDAMTPIVMRLSLDEVKSAAFSVEERDAVFVLVVKYSEKESRDIASFMDKNLAISALMSASAALEKGSAVSVYSGRGESVKQINVKAIAKWFVSIVVLCVLLVVIMMLSNRLPQAPLPERQATTANVKPPPQTGVPLSADAFLSR